MRRRTLAYTGAIGTAAVSAYAFMAISGASFTLQAAATKPVDQIDPDACAYVQGGTSDLGPDPTPTSSPEGYAEDQARQAFGDGKNPHNRKGKALKLKTVKDGADSRVLVWVDPDGKVNGVYRFTKGRHGWLPDMHEECSPVEYTPHPEPTDVIPYETNPYVTVTPLPGES